MSNNILAVVNGRNIAETDVQYFYQSLAPQIQQQFQGEAGMAQLLDELISQELFYAEAVEQNVETTEAFKVELEKFKENLLKQFSIRSLFEGITADEAEAKKFYEENQSYFASGAQVKASHILVETEETAIEIKKELDAGLSFEDAALKYSTCPSKDKGGDLGFFQKGQMVPEFEEATFNMEMNTISEPVKSQFGYHIILKTGSELGGTQPFEQVSDQIVQQLVIQKQNEIYMTKVEELKAKYPNEKM